MSLRISLAILAALVTPSIAHAHTGAEHALSFASGFAHPFTGLDHLLAMVAVGLWAGLNSGRALWVWPVAFVLVMLFGGALGMAGVELPMVETGILASVVVLGLLVLGAAQWPVVLGAALIAAFAVLHGHAHGAELPVGAAAVTYAAGFALGTAMLHVIGLSVAHYATTAGSERVVRAAGAFVAVGGLALAFV